MASSKQTKQQLCEICTKGFSCKAYLELHMRIHTGERPFQCSVCHKSFNQNSALTSHKKIHSKEKRYRCELCKKSFIWKKSYRQHVLRHSFKTKQFKCVICSVTFAMNSDLKKHMKYKHDPNYSGLHQCIFCGKTLREKLSLNEHYLSHIKERSYFCNLCHLECSRKRYLKTHLKTHDPCRQTKFKCDICSKTFAVSGNLRRHIQYHLGEKPFKCEICNAGYSFNYILKEHMQRAHSQERPFQCSDCGKTYKTNSDIRIHQKIHKKVKSHCCPFCQNKYLYNCSLKEHIRRMHTDDVPHKCEICGKGFKTAIELNGHFRVHTGERPFNCSYCFKPFGRQDACRKHEKTKHKTPLL